jgi:predicted dehydrogenase
MTKYKNLKIGIVGSGYWGINIIKTLEELSIKNVYIFDLDRSQLTSTKKKFPYIVLINSLDKLLKLNLDCYFLVTPATTHYDIAKKIILNKKDLFIEKPVTLSSGHTLKLSKLSKTRKTILMSGYIYNYNIYLKYIKENIIRKNKLGKIKYIFFERSNFGPIRNDASCIWDLASHDISSCLYLLDTKPSVVRSSGYDFLKKKIYDMSSIHLKSRGIKIEIKSTWISPTKNRKIIIVGEYKMLSFDELDQKNKIKIYDQYAKYPKTKKFKKSFFTPRANIFVGKTTSPKIKFKPPLREEILHFLQCIKFRKNPNTDIYHAYDVSKIIEKVESKLT